MKKNLLKTLTVAMLLLIATNACKKDINVTGVTLDKTTLTLTVGETETLTATVLPNDATNQSVDWTCSNWNIVTIDEDIVVTAKKEGTAIITVTTTDGNYTATCTVTVIPVEPGVVINGIKWATRNVAAPGTFAANPEDAGMFYQWNKKIGWSSTDPMLNTEGGTTWDTIPATGDTWEKANDPCPKGWRVPTHKEHQSLVKSGNEWTTLNGVNGCLFGSGDNTLFLSASVGRHYNNGSLEDVNTYGCYWSSNASGTNGSVLFFLSTDASANIFGNRTLGLPVRCVAE